MKQRRWMLGFFLLSMIGLLSACSFPGIASTNQQLPVVQAQVPAVKLPPVRFPQDEAPHRDLTEWWYYTGHMQAVLPNGQKHTYGFELVFFQALRSNLPPIYPAHFAITDVNRGEFHYDQRSVTEPDAILPNGTSTSGMDLHVADWSIKGLNGNDQLQASMKDYAIQLQLHAVKPPTLHNGNGLITYGLGGFSYYYSRTRMELSGTLLDHNQPLKVTGQAWMDHQWGNFLTLGGGGWDWYSIQLKNNTEMMLYVIRDASGKVLSTYVGVIGPDGKDVLLPGSALKSTPLAHWTSPVTGATYPSGWRVEINAPQVKADLTLNPQLKDQELVVLNSTGNTYWEGAVNITGRFGGQLIDGEGYVELTGYGK